MILFADSSPANTEVQSEVIDNRTLSGRLDIGLEGRVTGRGLARQSRGNTLQLGVSDHGARLLDGGFLSSLLLFYPGTGLTARIHDIAGALLDEGHARAVDPLLFRLLDGQGLDVGLKVFRSLVPRTLSASYSRSWRLSDCKLVWHGCKS
ncbi:hypothetical protein HG531_011127 [Fusarium graminearum]|nr:hypothetical protein HG531_011127 [Fusarium graminearum]